MQDRRIPSQPGGPSTERLAVNAFEPTIIPRQSYAGTRSRHWEAVRGGMLLTLKRGSRASVSPRQEAKPMESADATDSGVSSQISDGRAPCPAITKGF